MDTAQYVALFYLVPIALLLALLAVLFRVWWSRKLEDSLAYLVFLRERKVLFISLLVGLATDHLVGQSARLANGFGWLSDYAMLGIGIVTSVVGALLVFLIAWLLLRGGADRRSQPVVLDVPEHLVYSLGVVDRAESLREKRSQK